MSIAHQNAHTIIRDFLSKQHIERVWFAGCGGSLTGASPENYFLECEAKKLAVRDVTNNDFVYFQVCKSESFINSPYNSLQDLFSDHVIRGDIVHY